MASFAIRSCEVAGIVRIANTCLTDDDDDDDPDDDADEEEDDRDGDGKDEDEETDVDAGDEEDSSASCVPVAPSHKRITATERLTSFPT